jgi:hypothetical protein
VGTHEVSDVPGGSDSSPLYIQGGEGDRYGESGVSQITTRRRFLIGAAAAAVAVLVGVGFLKLDLAPDHHVDGQGPLGSFGDANSTDSMAFSAVTGGPIWSVGLGLCLVRGDQPAVLDGSVGPTKIVGTGFQYLGAFARQFPHTSGMALGSVEGFPPQVSGGTLQPIKGFAVSSHCQHPILDPTIPYTELDLGFGRTPDSSGGGWLGVDVGYNSGGRHHVVSLNYNFLICGPAVPQKFCAPPSSPGPSA